MIIWLINANDMIIVTIVIIEITMINGDWLHIGLTWLMMVVHADSW